LNSDRKKREIKETLSSLIDYNLVTVEVSGSLEGQKVGRGCALVGKMQLKKKPVRGEVTIEEP